jgi:hypothetical protein
MYLVIVLYLAAGAILTVALRPAANTRLAIA